LVRFANGVTVSTQRVNGLERMWEI
jgi:hypothetical protein